MIAADFGAAHDRPYGANILVVEDDALQRGLLSTVLAGKGHIVDTAVDGLSAVWKILEGSHDVVFVDYNIPEINGLAMARVIHDLMGEEARPMLIAVTGLIDRLRGRESLAEPAFDAVLAKSQEPGALFGGIDRILTGLPDRAIRQQAASELIERQWSEYLDPPETEDGRHAQPSRARILIVEDDPVQQIVLRSALQVQGYTVDIAQDGGRAVRMIREGAYDLVLFDYQIPEMDGLAASRLILGLMGESQRPRMIALTGRPEKLTARQSASGPSFDAVIPKTTDMTDLLATIERMLRLSPRPSTRRKAISSDIARGLVRPPIGADLPVFDLETFERARGMLAPEALAALGRDITRRSLGLLQKLRETPPNGLARTADVSKESNVLASVAALFGFERLAYLARGYARACAKSSPDILAYGENFATIIENTVLRIRSGTLPEDGPFPLDGGEAGSGADVLPGC